MTLKHKFYAIIAVAALGFLTLSCVWLVQERSHVLKAREDELQRLVDGPYSILTDYHRMEKDGQLSRPEAQKRALAIIRVMRYDRDNYFWINDLHPTMVMHPIQPQLEGQDLTSFLPGRTFCAPRTSVTFMSGAALADGKKGLVPHETEN
ncbi:MAG: cache domain-containing protein [Acidobacteriia bacterium]|nr:cache domain-containing protein [Terriglobia bacterium]